MNNEHKIDDDEWQSAKDIIVESVLGGKYSKNYEVAKADFKYGLEERDGPNQDESVVDIGAWISKDDVPDKFDKDEFENYLDELDEGRLKAIEDGASPTHEEFISVLRSWLVSNSEDPAGNCISAYGIYPLVHSNGNQCFFLSTITGYSMSYSQRIDGFFSDIVSAFGYLRKNGFVCADCDDENSVEEFINEHLR